MIFTILAAVGAVAIDPLLNGTTHLPTACERERRSLGLLIIGVVLGIAANTWFA